ncbi:hypothetical protein [Mesorhizobium sp. 8]|uniref:hypothetical protein n=1 Tax=Mesorhizobium sp. 8 TaxID=2584466 RepID=UPI00111F1141|nr:hypothetical protein [Mesorhizobium sp. 8]QDC01718.1 hypothetical protein FGU64_15515 [Mesorhizobium sp. 8]
MDHTGTKQHADHAIQHFRWVGGCSNAMFNLQIALGAVLSLANPRQEWDLPDTRQCHELLGRVYQSLGNAIVYLSDDIEIDHLIEGLLAAANLVRDIDRENFGSDRHKDDIDRTKKLIWRARIVELQQGIDKRRRERGLATVEKMRAPAKATEGELFG